MGLLFRVLYILTTFIQTVILFRIALKLVNANSQHSVVSWIYNTSDMFIDPFKGILSNEICFDKFCIELNPVVALVFYLIIGFVLSELGRSFRKTE